MKIEDPVTSQNQDSELALLTRLVGRLTHQLHALELRVGKLESHQIPSRYQEIAE